MAVGGCGVGDIDGGSGVGDLDFGAGGGHGDGGDEWRQSSEMVRIRRILDSHEGLLPMRNILRIMKKALPPDFEISSGAKEAVQDCASVFIVLVTSKAIEKCKREHRCALDEDDLLWSIETLGFGPLTPRLKNYFAKYRESGVMDADGSAQNLSIGTQLASDAQMQSSLQGGDNKGISDIFEDADESAENFDTGNSAAFF